MGAAARRPEPPLSGMSMGTEDPGVGAPDPMTEAPDPAIPAAEGSCPGQNRARPSRLHWTPCTPHSHPQLGLPTRLLADASILAARAASRLATSLRAVPPPNAAAISTTASRLAATRAAIPPSLRVVLPLNRRIRQAGPRIRPCRPRIWRPRRFQESVSPPLPNSGRGAPSDKEPRRSTPSPPRARGEHTLSPSPPATPP
uniref:Uncharacterized protein n=1 Tax=Arundo donax TaxID=35708 RepID=A0A0A8YAT7_ARUDO